MKGRQLKDIASVIAQIEKASGITEVSRVSKFEGYLEGVGLVDIEVHDRGVPGFARYSVVARTQDLDNERMATTNASDDLETAIATTHWYQLTRDR